jgi:hypothetical protein
MNEISSSIASAYKNVNIVVSIEKSSFPRRWIVTVTDEPGFFFERKSFLMKKNAFKYPVEAANEFSNKFWSE